MASCIQSLLPCFPSSAWEIDPKVDAQWRQDVLNKNDEGARWKIVKVKTRDEMGDFIKNRDKPLIDLERKFIVDVITGELYLAEDPGIVRFKCIEISIFSVVYAFNMTVINFVKTCVKVIQVAAQVLATFVCAFCDGKILDAFYQAAQVAVQGATDVVWPDLFRFVASPFYWLGMELGAIVGIFTPYEGRKIVSHVENSWHGYMNYRDDPRWLAQTEKREIRWDEWVMGEVCFFAWCFQVRGRLDDRLRDGALKHQVISTQDIACC